MQTLDFVSRPPRILLTPLWLFKHGKRFLLLIYFNFHSPRAHLPYCTLFPTLAQFCITVSLGITAVPRETEKQCWCKNFGVGGQIRWEMCKWRINTVTGAFPLWTWGTSPPILEGTSPTSSPGLFPQKNGWGLFPPHPIFKGKALGTRLVNVNGAGY